MPESLREEFVEKAQSEGTSARQLILSWINQYLEKAKTNYDGEDNTHKEPEGRLMRSLNNSLTDLLLIAKEPSALHNEYIGDCLYRLTGEVSNSEIEEFVEWLREADGWSADDRIVGEVRDNLYRWRETCRPSHSLLSYVLEKEDYSLTHDDEASSITDVIDRFNTNLPMIEHSFNLEANYLERISEDIVLYKIHEPFRRNFDLIHLYTGIPFKQVPPPCGKDSDRSKLRECLIVVDDNIHKVNQYLLNHS
jgi:hypothetical protein